MVYPAIRQVYGEKAQKVGAATSGLYGFFLGLMFGQIACQLFGVGG